MESTLVTVEQLKALTSISDTMDCELLQPHLLIAQQLYVAPVLGNALYNDILAQFDANTISGNTTTLLDEYITPAIGFSAWFSISPFLAYKTQRSGIQALSSPDNTPVTPEELSLYIARVENYKDFYCLRLQKYLDANESLFPLYRSGDSQEVSKGGGLYLGFKSRRNNGCCGEDYGWQ